VTRLVILVANSLNPHFCKRFTQKKSRNLGILDNSPPVSLVGLPLVVEAHHRPIVGRQVGHDKADAGEQFPAMELHLRTTPAPSKPPSISEFIASYQIDSSLRKWKSGKDRSRRGDVPAIRAKILSGLKSRTVRSPASGERQTPEDRNAPT
jgi:hypothetical protein